MVANFTVPGEEFEEFGDDFELDDADIQVLEVSDISIQTPAVSDNLLGTNDELDAILNNVDLDFEVDLEALLDG